MVAIDTPSSLESFRRFVISSTCISYAPRAYLEDTEVFAEREDNLGAIKWRQLKRNNGKVTGEASANSLANLSESGVLTLEWVENYLKKKSEEAKTEETTS